MFSDQASHQLSRFCVLLKDTLAEEMAAGENVKSLQPMNISVTEQSLKPPGSQCIDHSYSAYF